jgi:hypothetical protein
MIAAIGAQEYNASDVNVQYSAQNGINGDETLNHPHSKLSLLKLAAYDRGPLQSDSRR